MSVEDITVRETPQASDLGRRNSTPSTPLAGGHLRSDRQVMMPNVTGVGRQMNGHGGVIVEESDDEEPEWSAPPRGDGTNSVVSAFEPTVFSYDDLILNLNHCGDPWVGSVGIGSMVREVDLQEDPPYDPSAQGSMQGNEFTVPKILQEALKRIEDGFQKIRTQQAQRDEVVQGLATKLQQRFQRVNEVHAQLRRDINDSRGEIRQVGIQIQTATEDAFNRVTGELWETFVNERAVAEGALQSVVSDLRTSADAL